MQLYISSWTQGSRHAWIARHNLSAADYQKDFDTLPRQGYRPVCVGGVSSSGEARFVSLWDASSGPSWTARHGIPAQDYQLYFDDMVRQGYRLRCLSGYLDQGREHFVALWERSAAQAWSARHGMTTEGYQREFDAHRGKGFRPVWITVYPTSAGVRYGAIWDQTPSAGWVCRHNIDHHTFAQVMREQQQNGYRLLCAHACRDGNRDVYAGIWEKIEGTYQQRHGLTAADHQIIFDRMTATGFRFIYVAGYEGAYRSELGTRLGLLIKNDDFSGVIASLDQRLRQRGYDVSTVSSAESAVKTITERADVMQVGDRLFIYLGVHGGDPRPTLKDQGVQWSAHHILQPQSGTFTLEQIQTAIVGASQRGADITLFDGSCNGGETVLAAIGQRYSALSTVGVRAPGLTNFPDPAQEKGFKDQDYFGTWPRPGSTLASQVNGQLRHSKPARVSQRIFRNDNCKIARQMLFWRSAIGCFGAGGWWNLRYLYCVVFQYLYGESYKELESTEQKKFTVSVEDFIARMKHEAFDEGRELLHLLQAYLNDVPLNQRAEIVYAARHIEAWEAIGFKRSWWRPSEVMESANFAGRMVVRPSKYGRDGYGRLVDDTKAALASVLAMEQELNDKLRALNSALVAMGVQMPVRSSVVDDVEHLIPTTRDEVRRYNELSEQRYQQFKLRVSVLSEHRLTEAPSQLENLSETQIEDIAKKFRLRSLPNINAAIRYFALRQELLDFYDRRDLELIRLSNLMVILEDAWVMVEMGDRPSSPDVVYF